MYTSEHHSINQEAHTRKRTCRKLQHAHMYVFNVIIIEPVISSHGAIHLPWHKVGFEKFFQKCASHKNAKLNSREI